MLGNRGHTLRTLGLIASLVVLIAAPPALAAKKKAKAKPFSATSVVNQNVPEFTTAPGTSLKAKINVGKSYKGKVIGDLNVTGIQTTGSVAGAANDLTASLTGPTGRTLYLFRSVGDQSLGPWTLDDDTSVGICSLALATPCAGSLQTLRFPFAGTSNLVFNDGPSFVPLQSFDGSRMNGTWTLSVVDTAAAAAGNGTSVLNRWGLKITPAKPAKG